MGQDWLKQVYHNTVSLSVHGCVYICVFVCVCVCVCVCVFCTIILLSLFFFKGENPSGILENVLLSVYDHLRDGLVINFTTQPTWNCMEVKLVICSIFNQSNPISFNPFLFHSIHSGTSSY